MNANNDAHVLTRLHARLVKQLEADAVLGDFHTALQAAAEIKAVADAIRALSAHRGEAVARAGDGDAVAWRTETPYGVGYLFADELIEAGVCLEGKPPSPAESAEVDDLDRIAFTRWYATQASATPSLGDAYIAGRCDGYRLGRRVDEMAREIDAAPSGVSDAMVERALVHRAKHEDGAMWPGDYSADEQHMERENMRATLEAAQPQPGRVEGMVLVPVDEIERAVKVMRYAAHPHTSPNADALAKFIAPSPTAGGDA